MNDEVLPLTRKGPASGEEGCELCRTHAQPDGGPWCARCRPAEYEAEVQRLKRVLLAGGSVDHFDEVNKRRYVFKL